MVQVADGVEVADAPVKLLEVVPGMIENACRAVAPAQLPIEAVILAASEVPVSGANVIFNSVGFTTWSVMSTPLKVQGLEVAVPPSGQAAAEASEV
jgi:hypothetical protein